MNFAQLRIAEQTLPQSSKVDYKDPRRKQDKNSQITKITRSRSPTQVRFLRNRIFKEKTSHTPQLRWVSR